MRLFAMMLLVCSGSVWLAQMQADTVLFLAFESSRNGVSHLYLMRADGTVVEHLTHGSSPMWLGDYLVFERDEDIFRINPLGDGLKNLTNSQAVDWLPIWLPDGSAIEFRSRHADTRRLYRMSPQGENTQVVTMHPGRITYSVWSPDMTMILFTFPVRNATSQVLSEIYTMRPDLTDTVQITTINGREWDMQWSPDGKWMSFAAGWDEPAGEIYKMRSDGSMRQRLTFATGTDEAAVWSSNGEWIAFASDRNRQMDIYKMRSDGSAIQRLTYSQTREQNPTWSPAYERTLHPLIVFFPLIWLGFAVWRYGY